MQFISFDKCIQSCPPHHWHTTKYLHSPWKSFCPLTANPPFTLSNQCPDCLWQIILACTMVAFKYILFCVWFLWLSTASVIFVQVGSCIIYCSFSLLTSVCYVCVLHSLLIFLWIGIWVFSAPGYKKETVWPFLHRFYMAVCFPLS